MTGSLAPGEVTAVSVHGPRGVVDLTVPTAATCAEVARVYAAEAGLGRVLPLVTGSGRALAPDATLEQAGLPSGTVLVAVDPDVRPQAGGRRTPLVAEAGLRPGALSALWCGLAAAVAVLAGWTATRLPDDDRTVAVVVLAVAALVGCLPFGPLAAQRVMVAPAYAAAAVLAVAWDADPDLLPIVVGAAALGAALTAAVGRALTDRSEEALRVWIVVGTAWFVVAGLAAVLSQPPRVPWAVLLIAAVLAARLVPAVVIDLPDQYLIDVQRLAVTAWSARDRPTGRRGRIVVPPGRVVEVAARGARLVDAAAVAILVVVAVSAPLLLLTADLPLDRVGARLLVLFGGGALLLAARSHRHATARRMLRLAGVYCVACVAVALPGPLGDQALGVLTGVVIGLGFLVLVAAVAVGRGWRSAWWSRRAEVAEVLCGAAALASLVVAVGLFRHLWEITG
ncbi:hypothetical protein [Nocardioides panacisoli]|uniref:Type VII secretion integral membrane protein EccD n=1 Tax=Nocardioides panacisoli TaxID=627624 RepID=A0ABP7IKE9_9ACTN